MLGFGEAKVREIGWHAARWAAAAGLALALAPAAQAGPLESVAAAFGNTILATYPDGRNQRIWLHPDGRYDGIGRRGKPSSGRWSLKDDKVCLKQSKPFPAPISYCTEFPTAGGVGATWISKDIAGIPIQLTLIEGIAR
ncbi:hypothetical protein [Phenylobacterium sp.]|jgi:hypothetical protein|uniref:hypothetical protein n=1 Tax=Phenylobacterium sp. TaxID=1871053 RepID=UPI0037839648